MTVQSWSGTAANNVLANTGFTMDEGMSPSSVNDSVRQLMADVKTRFDGDFATTATAAGTTTLTASSVSKQEFTGATTQTVVLPVSTTLTAGRAWEFINNSTGTVTINSSGANLVQTLLAGERVILLCILASGTTAASWARVTLTQTGVTQTAFAGATTLLTLGGTGAIAVVAIPGTLAQSGTTGALTVAGGAYFAGAILSASGVILSSTEGDTALNRSREGTFVSSASGPMTATNTTISFTRVGNLVTLTVPAVSNTGNTTATHIALSALPTYLYPVTTIKMPIGIKDNGTEGNYPGMVYIDNAGTFRVYRYLDGTSFSSNSGATGFNGFTISYEFA